MTVHPHSFIAIPIPLAIKEKLVEWQDDFKKDLPYKQWTNKADFHITLKFFGAVQPDKVRRLVKELYSIEEIPQFSLDLSGVQTFGNPSAPRVLFANVELTDSLNKLVDLVELCAEKCDFDKEKRAFRGHITLAKKWADPAQKKLVEAITNNYQNLQHTFKVEHVHLYQIHPDKNPKYEAIESFTLKGGERDRTAY